MRYTKNLGLRLPEYNDPVNIENINDNMRDLDDKLTQSSQIYVLDHGDDKSADGVEITNSNWFQYWWRVWSDGYAEIHYAMTFTPVNCIPLTGTAKWNVYYMNHKTYTPNQTGYKMPLKFKQRPMHTCSLLSSDGISCPVWTVYQEIESEALTMYPEFEATDANGEDKRRFTIGVTTCGIVDINDYKQDLSSGRK